MAHLEASGLPSRPPLETVVHPRPPPGYNAPNRCWPALLGLVAAIFVKLRVRVRCNSGILWNDPSVSCCPTDMAGPTCITTNRFGSNGHTYDCSRWSSFSKNSEQWVGQKKSPNLRGTNTLDGKLWPKKTFLGPKTFLSKHLVLSECWPRCHPAEETPTSLRLPLHRLPQFPILVTCCATPLNQKAKKK